MVKLRESADMALAPPALNFVVCKKHVVYATIGLRMLTLSHLNLKQVAYWQCIPLSYGRLQVVSIQSGTARLLLLQQFMNYQIKHYVTLHDLFYCSNCTLPCTRYCRCMPLKCVDFLTVIVTITVQRTYVWTQPYFRKVKQDKHVCWCNLHSKDCYIRLIPSVTQPSAISKVEKRL